VDTLWEVDPEFQSRFVDGGQKGRWYDALETLPLESAPELSADDSVATWDYILRDQPSPGSVLFHGDIHTKQDGFDDPNVSFAGNCRVKEVAIWLSQNRAAILSAFEVHQRQSEMWLYEPLTRFFDGAAQRGKAVIVLWTGPTKW
jgi:hypothetical protein